MNVVSNASPLINLSRIGRLALLPTLYQQVTVPMEDPLLLMDERLGRAVAQHLGVRCMGLIGILIEARHRGVISALKPELDALRDVAGLRLSEDLYVVILREAGEVEE